MMFFQNNKDFLQSNLKIKWSNLSKDFGDSKSNKELIAQIYIKTF